MAKTSLDIVTQQDVISLAQQVVNAQIRRFWQQKCKLVIPVTPPHKPHPGSHFHTFPEMFVQISGSSKLSLPQKVLNISVRQICLIPRLTAHVGILGRTPCDCLVVNAHNGRITLILTRDRHANVAASFISPQASRIEQCLNDIVECSRNNSKHAMHGFMLATLGKLLEISQSDSHEQEHHKVAQCRQIIQDHLGDKALSVGSLAKTIKCSRDYLSYLFHAETGTRLTEYINTQRIARACELLDHTPLNVSETAAACGYPDASYFSWLFRKTTGMTPKSYRRRHKAKR